MTLGRRLPRIVFLLIALSATILTFGVATVAESPQAGEPAAARTAAGKHLRAEGLPNFGEVTPRLYRGGQPTPQGFNKLAEMGVAIVVDFGRSPRDEKQTRKLGMEYVTIPWHCPFPKDEAFAKFLKLVKENPDKKIFAHCRLGDDRTGMMIAAYRMGTQGWSADEAMNEMKQFGFSEAHHFICPGLAGYERSFPERFKKNKGFDEVR
jgi:tyrosine-protein phosphatase SIW14